MNSGVLGECGCKHMPSPALQTLVCQPAVAVHLASSSSPPAVPGRLDARRSCSGALSATATKQTGLETLF